MDAFTDLEPARGGSPLWPAVLAPLVGLTILLAVGRWSAARAGAEGALIGWAAAASVAAAVGALVSTAARAASGGSPPGRRAALVTALPLLLLGLAGLGELRGSSGLPRPIAGGAALSGLVALGACLGSTHAATGLARAALLAAVSLLLDGAAAGWGLLGPSPTWPAGVAAVLLDLSPRAFVLESGGVDWMRHPSIYETVGTDRIGPGMRVGWTGSVAGPCLVVVGCALAAFAAARSPGRTADPVEPGIAR